LNVALDTNVLAYAAGVNGTAKKQEALELIQGLAGETLVVPVQALGELFNVLVRKAAWTRAEAAGAVLRWSEAGAAVATTPSVLFRALELSGRHQFSIWDAVIASAAAEAGCRLLLSEDLQDGFTWRGVIIANPFIPVKQPLLQAILGSAGPH
jgi:predicted nucleic acid-binding protein